MDSGAFLLDLAELLRWVSHLHEVHLVHGVLLPVAPSPVALDLVLGHKSGVLPPPRLLLERWSPSRSGLGWTSRSPRTGLGSW